MTTIETILKYDKEHYPKYRGISRKVAIRLFGLLPTNKDQLAVKGGIGCIPQVGYGRPVHTTNDGRTIYLRNISGKLDTWVYYDITKRG